MKKPIILRSMLFVPGANSKALAKAPSLDADALIFDLEDAVGRDVLSAARLAILSALASPWDRPRFVRVNAVKSEDLAQDIFVLKDSAPDGIVLPKVCKTEDIAKYESLVATHSGISEVPIWVMLETAQGILNAQSILAHPKVGGMILGSNDLSKELRVTQTPDRAALLPAIAMAHLAARASGKWAIDSVCNQFGDLDLFTADATLGRKLGFDGKSLIHPVQIEPANRIFGPTEKDVSHSKDIIAAFEAAKSDGSSVAVLNGAMVEELHVVQARDVLARRAIIEQRNL